MMHFARKIHDKSDDLWKELVEFKSNGNTIVACFWISFMEKIRIIQKACHPFSTFDCEHFFFQKSSLRSDISINFKIRGTWKFNRRFVCRKTLKPLFLHSVYYTLTTDIRIPTMHLNSVIISMVMSHLSLAFSLFLFLASSSFWLLLLFAMKLEFVL